MLLPREKSLSCRPVSSWSQLAERSNHAAIGKLPRTVRIVRDVHDVGCQEGFVNRATDFIQLTDLAPTTRALYLLDGIGLQMLQLALESLRALQQAGDA